MRLYFIKILTIVLSFQGLSRYQTLDINSLRIAQRQAERIKNSKQETFKKSANTTRFVIDSPVNEEYYIVGPGDEFYLNIISSNETFDYNILISPTGTLLIPSVGIVDCKGLTLKELKLEIKRLIKDWNKNIKINVELKKIREFKILVTGQFKNAGYFVVTPMTRVSDLFDIIISDYHEKQKSQFKKTIEKPYSESLGIKSLLAVDDLYSRKFGPEDNLETYIDSLSRRNISLIRNNKKISIDLEKFKVTGDLTLNPYVHQNDIIKIPYKTKFFRINGGVQKPGKYEFKPNESLSMGIQIAGGFKPGIDFGKIKVTRKVINNNSESFFIDAEKMDKIILREQDHIMIPHFDEENPHQIVQITGQIKYPGSYHVKSGITTIDEVISQAGGFLPDADSLKFYITNERIASTPDRELERILLKEENYRSVEEKAYVKARIRTQKGSLEISRRQKNNQNYLLTNNDIILIPRSFPYVEVIGAVMFPGRYKYNRDIKPYDYITMAGGISKNASGKKFLVKSMTGQRVKLNNKKQLESGDVIFIAEKIEYEDDWYVFKQYLTSMGQLAVLVYYIQTIIEDILPEYPK